MVAMVTVITLQAPQRDKAMEDARRQQEARRIENERHHQKESRGQVRMGHIITPSHNRPLILVLI